MVFFDIGFQLPASPLKTLESLPPAGHAKSAKSWCRNLRGSPTFHGGRPWDTAVDLVGGDWNMAGL